MQPNLNAIIKYIENNATTKLCDDPKRPPLFKNKRILPIIRCETVKLTILRQNN